MLMASIVGAFSFLIRDVVENIILGMWIKRTGEVIPGDRVKIKSDFGEMEGTVKDVHLRNIIVSLENGEELLKEAKDIFEEDVIRRRD